jgi:hypothetical protein
MKSICWVLLMLSVSSLSFSQVIKPALTSELIFDRSAMKNLRFPVNAQRQGRKSVRVYVGFTLTEKGDYRNVSVVNSGFIDESIKQEINRVWSSLPNQSPAYAGNYVIPIDFLFGEGESDHLKEISNNEDEINKAGKYTLLNEISVIGYILCEKKSLTE